MLFALFYKLDLNAEDQIYEKRLQKKSTLVMTRDG